jgi:hypothetical protein
MSKDAAEIETALFFLIKEETRQRVENVGVGKCSAMW